MLYGGGLGGGNSTRKFYIVEQIHSPRNDGFLFFCPILLESIHLSQRIISDAMWPSLMMAILAIPAATSSINQITRSNCFRYRSTIT